MWCKWHTKFLKIEYFHQLFLWCHQFILIPAHQIKPYPSVKPWRVSDACSEKRTHPTLPHSRDRDCPYTVCWHLHAREDQDMACLLGGLGSFRVVQKIEEKNNIKADTSYLIHWTVLHSPTKSTIWTKSSPFQLNRLVFYMPCGDSCKERGKLEYPWFLYVNEFVLYM